MDSRHNFPNNTEVQTKDASLPTTTNVEVNGMRLSDSSGVCLEVILTTLKFNFELMIPLEFDHPGDFGLLILKYRDWKLNNYFSDYTSIKVSGILLRNASSSDWDQKRIITRDANDCRYLFNEAIKENYTDVLAIHLTIIREDDSFRLLTIHSHDFNGFLFHRAAMNNNMKMMEVFLKYNLNDVEKIADETPLHVAVRRGHLEIVKFLLNKGTANHLTPEMELETDIDAVDVHGNSALLKAAELEDPTILKLLIASGANINLKNEFGETTLHLASRNPKIPTDVIELILDSMDDINVRTVDGDTAIHYAALNSNINTINCLIEKNADVNATNTLGTTPLHLLMSNFSNAAISPELECLKVMIGHKVNINAVDCTLTTPLHYACFTKNPKTVKYLLENGADSSMKDKEGRTVFHFTRMNAFKGVRHTDERRREAIEEVLNILVEEKNITVNCVDKTGSTPLHYYEYSDDYGQYNAGSLTIHQALLNIGADINILNNNGESTFDILLRIITLLRYFKLNELGLLEHVIKMKAMKFWVRKEILNKCFDTENEDLLNWMQSYERDCNKEIDAMKCTYFDQCNLTYYHFLKKSPHDAISFTQKDNIVNAIKSDDLINRFPIYGHFFKCFLREAQRRNYLYEQIQEPLKQNSLFKELTVYSINEILKYLNDSDLKVFKSALEPVTLV